MNPEKLLIVKHYDIPRQLLQKNNFFSSTGKNCFGAFFRLYLKFPKFALTLEIALNYYENKTFLQRLKDLLPFLIYVPHNISKT